MAPDQAASAVRAAAAAWRWVPYDAVWVDIPAAELAAELAVSGGEARVHRLRPAPGVTTAALVAEVVALAAGHGAEAVTWIVTGDNAPADLPEVLSATGAVLREDLVVLGRLLDGAPALRAPVPSGVEICRVETAGLLNEAYAVDSAVLGTPARSAEFRRKAAAALAAQQPGGAPKAHSTQAHSTETRVLGAGAPQRFVARAGGRVVATAGLTLAEPAPAEGAPAGPVARLWGAAVLPAYRGRGIYWALLGRRLSAAAAAGAGLAVARARTGTTAPVLRRAGFIEHGRERHYRQPSW